MNKQNWTTIILLLSLFYFFLFFRYNTNDWLQYIPHWAEQPKPDPKWNRSILERRNSKQRARQFDPDAQCTSVKCKKSISSKTTKHNSVISQDSHLAQNLFKLVKGKLWPMGAQSCFYKLGQEKREHVQERVLRQFTLALIAWQQTLMYIIPLKNK